MLHIFILWGCPNPAIVGTFFKRRETYWPSQSNRKSTVNQCFCRNPKCPYDPYEQSWCIIWRYFIFWIKLIPLTFRWSFNQTKILVFQPFFRGELLKFKGVNFFPWLTWTTFSFEIRVGDLSLQRKFAEIVVALFGWYDGRTLFDNSSSPTKSEITRIWVQDNTKDSGLSSNHPPWPEFI